MVMLRLSDTIDPMLQNLTNQGILKSQSKSNLIHQGDSSIRLQ